MRRMMVTASFSFDGFRVIEYKGLVRGIIGDKIGVYAEMEKLGTAGLFQ